MWLAGGRPVLVVSFSQYGFSHINQKGSGFHRSPFFVVDGGNNTTQCVDLKLYPSTNLVNNIIETFYTGSSIAALI